MVLTAALLHRNHLHLELPERAAGAIIAAKHGTMFSFKLDTPAHAQSSCRGDNRLGDNACVKAFFNRKRSHSSIENEDSSTGNEDYPTIMSSIHPPVRCCSDRIATLALHF